MMACELCGQPGPHRSWLPDQRIVRCQTCGLVFYEGTADANVLYNANYFGGGEYHDYQNEKKSLQRNFKKRIDDLLKRVQPGGALLEIGCAYGYFLESAGRHWRTQGLDIVPEAIHRAREQGQNAECAEFLSLPDRPDAFDIICLWDTIEHLPHPVRTLEKAARWLKPGGILMLSTGDIDSRVARWRGARWRQIHPPTHLYYFSPRTIARAFQKSGLILEDLQHPGQFRNYGAMVSKVFSGRGAHGSWMSSLATFGGRLDFPVYLNLWDLMVATARKPLQPSDKT